MRAQPKRRVPLQCAPPHAPSPPDWSRVRTCSYAACGAVWFEADVPHRCRRAQGDARRRSMRARYLFLSSRAARALRHLTTRNATRTCKIYVGLPPRTVREPVRPRVTKQCVSPSLHSASQSVGPGRKAVRKAVWPPKPTANQEAGMFVPSLFSRLSSFHLMWTGCGADSAISESSTRHRLVTQFFGSFP